MQCSNNNNESPGEHRHHQRRREQQQGIAWGYWSGPQRFTVETCPTCKINKILLDGETWHHDCQAPPHIIVWITPVHAACTGCDWRHGAKGSMSRGGVREVYRKAHLPLQ